jgi:hypothetical protein
VPKTTYLIMGQDLASTRQTRRHSPSTFARTRQTRRHSPSHVARTRQTRRHSPKAIFEKNVTRLDTFARVIRHFREFGASRHCLLILQDLWWGKDAASNYFIKFFQGGGRGRLTPPPLESCMGGMFDKNFFDKVFSYIHFC